MAANSHYGRSALLSASCCLVAITDMRVVADPIYQLPIIVSFVAFILFLLVWYFQPRRSPLKHPVKIPACVYNVLEPFDSYETNGTIVVVGKLKVDSKQAFEWLRNSLRGVRTPILQGDENHAILLLSPTDFESRPRTKVNPLVHIALGVLTVVTTTAAGARIAGGNWLIGLTYSLPLMAILGLHEFGHFAAARAHKMDVTPPFFVPIPFGLGTFGAFIQMRSPAEDRKGLFDVAISGPLAGFVVAVPTLLYGLQSSDFLHPARPVTQIGSFWQGMPASSSLLFSFMCEIVRPGQLQFGDIVLLSPIAFAGWIGVWITALNLIPLGQLDGGHAAHGLLGGSRIGVLNRIVYFVMIIGGFVYWPGLITWALLVYFLAGESVPPLNDVTPVNGFRKLIGLLALLILVSTFCPVPSGNANLLR